MTPKESVKTLIYSVNTGDLQSQIKCHIKFTDFTLSTLSFLQKHLRLLQYIISIVENPRTSLSFHTW